ncbi:MAG: hypothetical protein KI791_06275 [Cyclobacteriaceae bacterium]|nr:hypothetical protein [Cyclobacteriaceae bacterium SS2]
MDHKNKTDQFFREKLDQVEFQPSNQAWKMVQGSIASKKAIPWAAYTKVAASLALLLTLGYLFYPRHTEQVLTIDEVTSPAPMEMTMIEVEANNQKVSITQKPLTQEPKTARHTIPEITNESIPPQRTIIELASIDEINISKEVIAEEPSMDQAQEKPAVTITYYTARSVTEPVQAEDSSKVNLFDKVKFFAKNVSAVDLLSDIRTAKEELIENGFKRN